MLSVRVFGTVIAIVLKKLDHLRMMYVENNFIEFVTMAILFIRYLVFPLEMLLAGLSNLNNYIYVCAFYIIIILAFVKSFVFNDFVF